MEIHGAVHTGDHVVSTLMEHNSVLRPLSELARSGIITLTLVPPDADGRIHAQEIERALTARTRLVAMTHMSNVLGLEQDVACLLYTSVCSATSPRPSAREAARTAWTRSLSGQTR